MQKKKWYDNIVKQIRNAISRDILYQYWIADNGCRLGIYEGENGELKADVGLHVGRETSKKERPISYIYVPGIENLDIDWLTMGWIIIKRDDGTYITMWGEKLTLKEVLKRAAYHEDSKNEIEKIVNLLMDDIINRLKSHLK